MSQEPPRPPSGGPPSSRPAVVAAALLVGPQVAAKATRDALFLSHFPVSSLPVMTAAAAVVSLAGTLAFSRALARLSPARVLPLAVGASGALFLGEWGLALSLPRLAAVVVYLHHALLGAMLVSGFWSLVSESFDPHRAKHSMAAIGAGASLGGVAGGLLTWRAAALIGVPTMLVVLAVLSALSLASLLHLVGARKETATGKATPAAADEGAERPEARSGLALIRETPYLRGLAALVALSAFVEALLDYLLGAAATASVGRGPALMSFYALFHASTGLLALLVQALLVRPLLVGAGLTASLATLPGFTVAAALVALAVPRLGALVALRGGQAVLRNSAFRSGYELLYAPLDAARKRPTKVIIDVACDRAGTVAGSGAVLLCLAAPGPVSSRALLLLAALAAAAAVAFVPRFQKGYVAALAETLRAGAPGLDRRAMVEPITLLTLASVHLEEPPSLRDGDTRAHDPVTDAIADLRSGAPPRVERALAADELDPRLVGFVLPLLVDDALFPTASAALRRSASRCTGQLVDALLDARLEPAVRRRVARVLREIATPRAAEGLVAALADERFDVRYRSAQALARLHAAQPALAVPRPRVLELAARAARHAARSPRHLDHVFDLVAIVLDARALEIAREALAGGDAHLRGTALEYLDNVLPPAVREAVWPALGGAARPARTGRSPEEIRDDLLRSVAASRATPPEA